MSSWRDDFSLLRDRNVLLLFFGRTLSMLGMAFAPVALAFGVLHLPHGSESLLSTVLAAEAIPLIILLLVGGVIADRYPRQVVLLVSQLFAALAYAALAWLVGHGVDDVVALCTAAALSGVGGALGWPAFSGLIPQVLPADKLQQGNAVLSFGASVARIVGIVAGGVVTAAVGGGWALAVSALMYLLCGLGAMGIRTGAREPATAESRGGMLTDLREGWGEFVAHEWLWVVVAQWALLIMCFNAAQSVLGPVIADRYLGGAGPWSWFLAGQAVGDVAAVLLALRWKPRRPILVPVAMTAATVWLPFFLLAVGAPLWAVVVAGLALGLSFTFFGILWNTTMQREVPADALSRVSSYDAMGSMMFGPIGLLLAGPAAAAFGARPAMLWCSVLLLVVGASALASRDVRTLTWRDEPLGGEPPAVPLLADDESPIAAG